MVRKIKILLVDDDAEFTRTVEYMLNAKGYSVKVAPEGQTAVRLAKEETPDILLLDLRMPIMDGLEVLKKIREFNKDLPVVLISAYVNDPRAGEALAYGISGVFYKEKSFEEIMPMLETILRTHKSLKKE
jgi:CheY-like chemotaxis protein